MSTALLLALSLLQAEPAAAQEAKPAATAEAAAASAPASPAATAAAVNAEPAPSVAPAAQGAEVAPTPPAAPPPAPPPPPAAAEAAPSPLPPAPAPVAVEPATAPVAAAAEASPPASPKTDGKPRWEAGRRGKSITHFGLTIDGGFPDAAGLALVYRPLHWIRLEAGATTTVYASHGYRVGASLVPFNFPLTPALTVNYGRALEADWNPLYNRIASPNPDLEPVLRKFGYQYVDAHLGLEMGAPRRFVFFIRAGLTQLWTSVHGLTDAAASSITEANTSVTISDAKITVRMPSFKVGFLVYLF